MIRIWLAAAAVGGFLSVAAGAFAAHLITNDERAAELLRTGALYGMVHAAALIGVAALAGARGRPGAALLVAGWGFAAGMAAFSLSLFALALTGIGWLGLLTPFGGAGLLVGWAALGLQVCHRR